MRQKRIEGWMPVLATVLLAAPLAAAPARSEKTLEEKVESAILASPRYGPFDLISFEVTGSNVALSGSVYQPLLKETTEKRIAAIPGVTSVVSTIEVLPLSFDDDRLRRAVFATIYRDGFLAKYGTPATALGLGRPVAGFPYPGREPSGRYAIHVIVDRGRVTLYGRVDNAVDRDKAAFDARTVFGVKSVENKIEVLRPAPTA